MNMRDNLFYSGGNLEFGNYLSLKNYLDMFSLKFPMLTLELPQT